MTKKDIRKVMRGVIVCCGFAAIATFITSCNDEWKDEQYEQYISFRAPLNDQGVTSIYVPYTRKAADGTPLFGDGQSNYQLPVIVSGSTHNSRSLNVRVAHDPDTLNTLNWARFATRTELYYADMISYASFPETVSIPSGQDIGLLDIRFDFKNLDLVEKWVLPLTVVDEGYGYEANPRKNYKKAMLRVFPFNDYSGDYSATGLTISVQGDANSTGLEKLRTYVVDNQTVFFYAGRFDESSPWRKYYKIYAHFNGTTSGTVTFTCDNPEVEFKVNKEASYRIVESDDQTQPYLRYRNVIINNIDYDFADYTSSVGSKFYYNISGTVTLQRTINTQIPDEDQAIQW